MRARLEAWLQEELMTRVLLTGATGFLGRHALPVLQAAYGERNVTAVSSRDYDLMRADEAERMVRENTPDAIVHLAA